MEDRTHYKFLAAFGDEDREVDMALMGFGYIKITVGNYYYGCIVNYYQIGWTVCPSGDPCWFRGDIVTTEDLDALLDRAVECGFIAEGDTINYGSGWKLYHIPRTP